MEMNLTNGAIKKIIDAEVKDELDMIPVLQVTDLKLISTQVDPAKQRYRLMLSDGSYKTQGMLATDQNQLVNEGILQVHSIVRLNHFLCSNIKDRIIVIITDLEVIATISDRIGSPEVIQVNPTNQPGVDSGKSSNTTGIEKQVKGGGQVNNVETVRSNNPVTISPQVGQQRQAFGNGSGSGSSSGFPGVDSGHSSHTTGFENRGRSELTGGRQVNNAEIGRSNPVTISPQVGQQRQVFGNGSGSGFPGVDSGHSSHTTGFENQGRSESAGSRQVNNAERVRSNPVTVSPQVGQQREAFNGSGIPGSTASTRAYGNPSAGHGVHGRDPHTAYPRQPQQPPPMYSNRGPVARNEAPPRIIPINALSPYSGRWTIKARVTSKGELRHYNNQRGDGKVFSFDLLDADGGEIRVTCFNAVADQFFDQIVVGNLYLISKGTLKPAQKNFNHLRNEYEIMLDNATTIQQCYEEDATIPRHQFHFRSICDIENMEANSIMDVIGIVSSISPTVVITKKNGTETQKRAVQLKDMSGRSVEVTMWGNFCDAEGQRLQSLYDSGGFPVLAVKTGRISEFNGKAVSTIGSSQLFIEPDFVEAQKLKEWFEREGRSAPCISLSREFTGNGRVDVRKTLSQIKGEKLGTSEKPDWITVSATIIFMKFDNFCYTACPIMNGDRPCSKKVTDNGDGTWRCEKCDKCVDECDYRYILQLQIQDHTDLTWVTAFQEAGEEIMGMSAKDLYYVKYEHGDEEKFEDIIRKVAFSKYIFKLKVKEETFSDEQRVKATVVRVDKVNYSSDTRTVSAAMDKLRTAGDGGSLPTKPEGSHYNADAVNNGYGSSGLPANQSSGSRPQGQFMGGSYGSAPRQHVGRY
ncbi:hypothetical protein AALP_AA7G015700 [Arabis alpina]|uniref:Replication protein A subunit n=1 Tax=Arabis alpina TaxID=50452 RepID=A0A087GFC9_ARAAL|nr:hypothetical protein AALP_AA7G015700 [Arabis alpina]